MLTRRIPWPRAASRRRSWREDQEELLAFEFRAIAEHGMKESAGEAAGGAGDVTEVTIKITIKITVRIKRWQILLRIPLCVKQAGFEGGAETLRDGET